MGVLKVLVGLALRILFIQIHVGRNVTSFSMRHDPSQTTIKVFSWSPTIPTHSSKNQGAVMLSHHAIVEATTRESVSPHSVLPTEDPQDRLANQTSPKFCHQNLCFSFRNTKSHRVGRVVS
jgi:hypothetical protein